MLYSLQEDILNILFFASTVVGQCRQLQGVRAVGTDGEQVFSDAFEHEFGFAQHMTCFLHVQRNVKDMLDKCSISVLTSLMTSLERNFIQHDMLKGWLMHLIALIFKRNLRRFLKNGDIYPYLLQPIWRGSFLGF